MKLEVRLFAGLICNNPELDCVGKREFEIEVPEKTTLEELHQLLQLDSPHVLINLVNGKVQDKSCVLEDNDRVGIFPPAGGG
jgi:molybdopterin converting factor small subunit